ncbi:MAG: copper resistance protein CopC [Actinomycetota bacterium]|nr:copper resistance protein CopC [Actinomycetota bacterium]
MRHQSSQSKRTFVRFGAALAGVLFFGMGPAIASASAQSEVVSTVPANGAQLDAAPLEVAFTFDNPLLPGTITMAILGSDGRLVESQEVVPRGDTIAIQWPQALQSGSFQVAYRGASSAGLIATESLNFSIANSVMTTDDSSTSNAPAQVAEVPMVSSQIAHVDITAGIPAALLMSLGFLVLAAVTMGLVLLQQRGRPQ